MKFTTHFALHSQKSDQEEALEVAIQCLDSVYNGEQSDADNASDPLSQIDLFQLFLTSVSSSPEKKEQAENEKNEGNRLMKEEKYQEALAAYARAIALDATNPIFYCNRAAAFSRIGEYQKAVDDCNQAIRFDPNYGKAYGRLGLAYSKMNRHEEAINAYKRALEIEPDNQDYKNNLEVTTQRLEERGQGASNPLGAAAGLGGIDFAAALNNPSLVNMATRMMSDPSIQNMLGQLGSMNNVDALLETGRQLAMRMSNENPELFSQIREQMMTQNGGEDPNAPDSGENPPQQPPQQ